MKTKLTRVDKNFLALDFPGTPQVIASLCLFDRLPNILQIREDFLKQLRVFTKLRQKISGEFFVDDENFSLDNHLTLRSFPQAGTMGQLVQEAAQIFSEPLPRNRPLWSFTVLGGADPSLGATIFKLHHVVGDGLGGLEVVHSLSHSSRSRQRNEAEGTAAARVRPVPLPQNSTVDIWKSIGRGLQEAFEGPSSCSALNGLNSPARKIAVADLPLTELKQLKNQLQVSLNDILLTLVTDALRRYSLSHNCPPNVIKTVMPVNLRKSADRFSLGNHLTCIGVPLPAAIESPLSQLRHISQTVRRIQTDGSFGAYRWVAQLTGALPAQLRRKATNAMAHRTNLICTNMPGPRHELYLGGAKILANYGCPALLQGHGIAFGFITYAKKVCAVAVSDPQIIPDPEPVLAFFSDTLADLRAAAFGPNALSWPHEKLARISAGVSTK